MEGGEGAGGAATAREGPAIPTQAGSLLPEAAGMAAQSLWGHLFLLPLRSFWVGGPKPPPREPQLRSQKPLL